MKEEDYAKQFLRDNGWREVKGYRIDHSCIEESWECSYWEDLGDLCTKCVYWINEDYPENCFEDVWQAVDFIEDNEEIDFIKWRKENNEVIPMEYVTLPVMEKKHNV